MTSKITKYQSVTKKRPCDGCALRKIKCDFKEPCSECSKHNMKCTNIRERKIPGPKALRNKTYRNIEKLKVTNESMIGASNSTLDTINLSKLLPFLSIYHKLFYSVWPVVSVKNLVEQIIKGSQVSTDDKSRTNQRPKTSEIPITPENYSQCCLAYSLCAAVRCQISFISKTTADLKVPEDLSAASFANNACLIKRNFNFYSEPTIDKVLSAFFLYAYYVNVKGQNSNSIILLRESITMMQMLCLEKRHEIFEDFDNPESHRLAKTYYVLLVTERYTCVDSGIPVLLDSNIPLPSLKNEPQPEKIADFNELVKIFAIPNKLFFDLSIEKRLRSKLSNESNSFQFSYYPSKAYMKELQDNLYKISVFEKTPDVQKLNIILSKYWMKALAWRVCYENKMLGRDQPDVLNYYYPITIAQSFLNEQNNIHISAYESNGPGVCTKLFEIINALSFSLQEVEPIERPNYYGLITSLLKLINKFGNGLINIRDYSHKFAEIVAQGNDTLDRSSIQNFFYNESRLLSSDYMGKYNYNDYKMNYEDLTKEKHMDQQVQQHQMDIQRQPHSHSHPPNNTPSLDNILIQKPHNSISPQLNEPFNQYTSMSPSKSNTETNPNYSDSKNYSLNMVNEAESMNFNDFEIELLQDSAHLIENDSVDFSKFFSFEVNSNIGYNNGLNSLLHDSRNMMKSDFAKNSKQQIIGPHGGDLDCFKHQNR